VYEGWGGGHTHFGKNSSLHLVSIPKWAFWFPAENQIIQPGAITQATHDTVGFGNHEDSNSSTDQKPRPKCYLCGSLEHIARVYPKTNQKPKNIPVMMNEIRPHEKKKNEVPEDKGKPDWTKFKNFSPKSPLSM